MEGGRTPTYFLEKIQDYGFAISYGNYQMTKWQSSYLKEYAEVSDTIQYLRCSEDEMEAWFARMKSG